MSLPSVDLRELLASDHLEEALEGLQSCASRMELANEAIVLLGSLRHAERASRTGAMSESELAKTRTRVRAAALSLLSEITRAVERRGSPPLESARRESLGPTVFLSYSKSEPDIALSLRKLLRERGITVLFDDDDLEPGEQIAAFIYRAARAAQVVVVIASTAALSSSWVVFEAVTTLELERLGDGNRKLIGGFTDDCDLFNPSFRLKITETIDAKLAAIDRVLPRYIDEALDMTDLHAERNRLLAMRASLGQVLDRFKNSLSLNLRQATLATSADRIAEHVRRLRD